MKRLYTSRGARGAAHILLCACIYLLVACVAGIITGFEMDTLVNADYFESGLYQRQLGSAMFEMAYTGYDTVQNLKDPTEVDAGAQESDHASSMNDTQDEQEQAVAQAMQSAGTPPNVSFVLLRNGRILYSNVEGVRPGSDPEAATAQLERIGGRRPQMQALNFSDGEWAIKAVVDPALPHQDIFYRQSQAFYQLLPYTRAGMYAAVPALILCILLWAFLIKRTGVVAGEEGVRLYWLDRVYSDVFTLLLGAAAWLVVLMLLEWGYYYNGIETLALLSAIAGVPLYAIVMTWLLSIVRRARNRVLLRNSLIAATWRWCAQMLKRFWGLLGHIFGRLPLTFLGIVGALLLMLGNIILSFAAVYEGGAMLLYFMFCAAVLLLVFYVCSSFSVITKAAERIADGNLNAKADTRYLRGRLRRHADIINRIGDGLNSAVEEQLKSERFKTELVANISHDIKTPLTSIINYVDLLQKAPPDSEQVQQYLEVLERNTQRLKVLTEDLVDLSKATTGNVQLQLEALNLNELVLQAVGEYSEKLADNHLEVVLNLPDPPVTVHADGRHLWRVMENLFTNLTKYAMGHTRVYMDAQAGEQWAQFTMKNISAMALNVTPEELMERFVRGDAARHTDGSGLGLSIAKSLVELQGGTFSLAVDGDLFKVIIRLPMEKL